MNNNAQYVVKIMSKDEIGSGFLYFPSDSEYAYIFTAKHCVFGENFDNQAEITDISITFSDNTCQKTQTYCLTHNDKWIFDKVNNENDIALLVIPISVVPLWIDKTQSPKFFKIKGDEAKFHINGFPKSVNNEYKRTLGHCSFKNDQDAPAQFHIEVSDVLVQQYNADDLVQGYSGSGVFLESEGLVYVCGVVSAYEESSKRFLCIDFSILDDLMCEQNLPSFEIPFIETNPLILKDIQTLKNNTGRILQNRIKDKIGIIHLERKTIKDDLLKKIQSQKLTIVTGDAGIGKSALTKNALFELENTFEILAIQGEQLDKSSVSAIFKSDDLQLDNFQNAIASPKMKQTKVILIDSIEKVLESSNVATILDFLAFLNQNNAVKIVITCRTYAISQLQLRFLDTLSQSNPIAVPLLSDGELNDIANQYTPIKKLLEKPKLRKILQVPFNISKAVAIDSIAFSDEINSETKFKQLMWEYVVEGKDIEADPNKRDLRAKILSDIALRRAQAMTTFVKIDTLDTKSIASLEKDNIIEHRPTNKQYYTPAHDIYEDWALTRYIDTQFEEWKESDNSDVVQSFFDTIGTSPAIRRVFRIWLNEKLQITDYSISSFIEKVFKDTIGFWQDEVLIATLQSSYSQDFLLQNKALLFINDFKLLKRAILLLRVACQSPDFELYNQYKNEQLYQSFFLKPFGESWATTIDFLYQNRSELKEQYDNMIIPFLLDWGKLININKALPKEARNAALLILDFFKRIEEDESYFDASQKVNIEKVIHLLFSLTEVAQSEISTLLENALAQPKSYRHELSGKLLKIVLSWANSRQVCKYLPHLVLKIAEKKWFYYKPTAAEWKKQHKGMLSAHFPQRLERDEQFGLTNRYDSSYFPASGYQTPIAHLLDYHTEKALEFIVKLFNHSIQSLKKASLSEKNGYELEADKLEEISIVIDSKKYFQFGSDALWSMYRGTGVVTPYLLQSVLMALENYIL